MQAQLEAATKELEALRASDNHKTAQLAHAAEAQQVKNHTGSQRRPRELQLPHALQTLDCMSCRVQAGAERCAPRSAPHRFCTRFRLRALVGRKP